MLTKYRVFVSLLFCFSVNMFSQTLPTIDDVSKLRNWNYGTEIDDKNSNIAGSQYFEDRFLTARVSLLDNKELEIRYNAFKDEMEYKSEGKVFRLNKKDSLIVVFKSGNKIYEYMEYVFKKKLEKGYLVRKTNFKKTDLFAKEIISFVPYKDAANPYEQATQAHYRKDKNVYFVKLDDRVVEIPKKKKEFLKLFSKNQENIDNFLKSNKVDLEDENDLISTIRFLNSI